MSAPEHKQIWASEFTVDGGTYPDWFESEEEALEENDGGDIARYVLASVADEWKRQRDVAREALRALFENTEETDDFFYTHAVGKHWCEVCGESATDYECVTHAPDCIVGAAEKALAECKGGDA